MQLTCGVRAGPIPAARSRRRAAVRPRASAPSGASGSAPAAALPDDWRAKVGLAMVASVRPYREGASLTEAVTRSAVASAPALL